MEENLYITSSEEVIDKRFRHFMFILYSEWENYDEILRDIKGNAWLVQIIESPSYTIENASNLKQTTISFSWKEAEDINSYSIIGL